MFVDYMVRLSSRFEELWSVWGTCLFGVQTRSESECCIPICLITKRDILGTHSELTVYVLDSYLVDF